MNPRFPPVAQTRGSLDRDYGSISGSGSDVARVLRLQTLAREITQRELRNESGEIMRALDRGESFVVTRNGVPVGELLPFGQRRFVAAEAALAVFAAAPAIDPARFRADIDALLDQAPAPRA